MSEEPSLAKIVNNFEVLENSHQVDDFNQLKQNRMLCFCILSEKKLKIVLMKTAFDKETKYQTFSFLHLSSHYIKAHQVPVTYHSNKNIFPYHLLFRTNFIIKAKNMIQELLNSVVDEKKLPSNTTSQTQQNLRCPRCDSPNTKFCYYNNYNLTQPRHFCKTCRRYWTKGGALRNVPIGGGCRKAKPFSSTLNTPTSLNSNNNNPGCSTIVDGMGRFGHLAEGMDPSMWGSAPHGSHLLTLLRATTSQLNHNLTNPVTQLQYQPQQQLQYNLLNDGPTSYGLHELYQRLRSSNNDYLPMVTATAMPNTASVMEPVPLSAVDFGYWNSTMPWSDLSTTANGAYN